MEVKEIMENFRYNQGKFEEESVIEARKFKDEISEKLLEELKTVANNITYYAEKEDYILHFYAMYLLAEFREKRAFPIIINLIKQDQDDVNILLGDLITEDLGNILASTYDGNIESLYSIIANTNLNEFVRSAAFKTLEILKKYDIITQEQITNMIEEMLDKELQYDYSYVITNFVTFISENHLFNKIELVKELYSLGRVNEKAIGYYDDFIDDIYGNKTYHENRKMIDDTVKSLSWWACFNNGKTQGFEGKSFEDLIKNFHEFEDKKIREAINPKVGRNDPCPCGSGKKYKKCCINKLEKQVATPADYYIQESLKYYPKEELKKFYDEDTILIDEKLYKALKYKAIPLYIERNYAEETRRDIQNMEEAFDLIKEKCKKENITSIEDFDNKISIHYSLSDIIEGYLKIVDGKGLARKESQNKKIDFIVQISNMFKLDDDYKKDIIDDIIANYLYEEDFSQAKKVIDGFKDMFPEFEIFLNFKLSEVYLEDYEDIEKTLQPIKQSIEKYGQNEEAEIKTIEIYYEYALRDYYEDEEKEELKLYQDLWQLVKNFIEEHNIKSENDFDYKFEPEYCYYNILNRIERFYNINNEYEKERNAFLNEALTMISMDEYTKGIVVDGLVKYYCDKGNESKALEIADDFIKETPNNSNAILIKSNIYSNKENPDYQNAINIINKALDNKNCDNKHALFSSLAILYDECGNQDEATKYQNLAKEVEDDSLPF